MRQWQADWNESANLTDSPYPLSKTLAERRAWQLMAEYNQSAGASGNASGSGSGSPITIGSNNHTWAGDANSSTSGSGNGGTAFFRAKSLVVCNPSFVVGPPLLPRADGVSVQTFADLLNGKQQKQQSAEKDKKGGGGSASSNVSATASTNGSASTSTSGSGSTSGSTSASGSSCGAVIPRAAFNMVDVRDVAAAHIEAAVRPRANGR
jgi:hypothetical protein